MKFNITKEELYELFIIKNLSRKMVSEYYGCSEVNIKVNCRKYDIKKPKYLENKNKERKIKKVCPICKIEFNVIPLRNEGKWEQKYCSYGCGNISKRKSKQHKQKIARKIAAQRRVEMKNAIVPLTIEEKETLKEIYLNCPFGFEVDHIIPISKGGKHHPNNLQYLTIYENRKKSNNV